MVEGAVVLSMLLIYIVATYHTEKSLQSAPAQMHVEEGKEITQLPPLLWLTVSMLVIGLTFLIVGSKVLLLGATNLASFFGVSQSLVGLTIIAVGISLPELSVSLIAALRKHGDVAVGNILGSNIFNMLGILGISAMLNPLTVNQRVTDFDQWVLMAASVVLLLFLYTGRKIGRVEGGILLLGYVGYLAANIVLY